MGGAPDTGPFYLRVCGEAGSSALFCIYHAPRVVTGRPLQGSILAVHAFAEELNKTRAAVADGARALAAAGFAVLQIDLGGCGDSDSDFGDATWAGWLDDLAAAWAWLHRHSNGPRWLWGTRLGATLADQFGARAVPAVDGLVLWQPVVNGAQHLGQFLRLKTVGNLLRATSNATLSTAPSAEPIPGPVARAAGQSPRAELASGRAIEVAGYRLTPLLADAVESARLGLQDGPGGWVPPRVRWFDVSSQSEAAMTPVATRVVDRWKAAGSDVVVRSVVGNAFWQTLEIERCPSLVDATVAALTSTATSA